MPPATDVTTSRPSPPTTTGSQRNMRVAVKPPLHPLLCSASSLVAGPTGLQSIALPNDLRSEVCAPQICSLVLYVDLVGSRRI